ncbi:MAG: hypothetical protein U9R75_02025 [Candidatus Thermoplasmatota archaeon]|nr:hypothetical protein [Candidatus Thermoplasmatota archaeon]
MDLADEEDDFDFKERFTGLKMELKEEHMLNQRILKKVKLDG